VKSIALRRLAATAAVGQKLTFVVHVRSPGILKSFLICTSYSVAVPVVTVTVFLIMGSLDQVGLHTWDKTIDLGMILGSFVIGMPVYLLWLKILVRFGSRFNNRFQTHFVQCTFLYLSALVLAWQLWLSHGSKGIEYAYAVLVFSCILAGIAANGIFVKMHYGK